jgi:hypothetical protein
MAIPQKETPGGLDQGFQNPSCSDQGQGSVGDDYASDPSQNKMFSSAERFLQSLDPEATSFTFQTFDDVKDRKDRTLVRVLHGTLAEHWNALCHLNEHGAGIYVTVNQTDLKGRKAKNIVRVRAVFIDLDGAPLEPVMANGRAPHIITETSPGRWHVFWRIADMPLDQFEPVQEALIAQFNSDKSVHDLPRVMRVPGFMHMKGEPFLIQIKSTGDHAPFLAADFPQTTPNDDNNAIPDHIRAAKPEGRGISKDDEPLTPRDALNKEALENLDKWVPNLFDEFIKTDDGRYRITSKMLKRDLQEDLSISPIGSDAPGIVDFGLADMGDKRKGKRTPIELVEEHSIACKGLADGPKKFKVACAALAKRLGHKVEEPAPTRIKLVSFEEFTLDNSPSYLVQRLFASSALNLVWGPPKCGKTFWVFDVLMHVALGRPYRDRRIQQGTVVYCAFEGTRGLRRRREAWRIKHLQNYDAKVPLYFVTLNLDLINEHPALIDAIQTQLPTGDKPIAVVLDTLNRSFVGSESSDEDMSAYVKASDTIREAFDCSAIIVHHCGINETRPRGHTSLTGAVDAQLRVERNAAADIIVTVEWMKDDEGEGSKLASKLEVVEVGTDSDGLVMTSCVIVATELPKAEGAGLTKNEKTMLGVLEEAGAAGLMVEEWNAKAREAGLGLSRKADLRDFRIALQKKNRIYLSGERWSVPF